MLRSARTRWLVALLAAFAWSVTRATTGRDVVNTGGASSFARFWRSIGHPEVAGDFLRTTADATATTASFAVLGTTVSVGIGLLGALVLAERPWETPDRRRGPRAARGLLRRVVGLAFVVPRAVHEVVWALLLVQVLGFDPWVAVIAIGIQFGAVTAKVYADYIDTAPTGPYRTLRASGSPRTIAIVVGIIPMIRRDLVSYGFYRLECAVRAAAVLGIIGAGGLGFQLDLSFESLRYDEIWTLIIALMLLSGLADAWSARLRRRSSPRIEQASWVTGVALVPLAAWWVGLTPSVLWSDRTRRLAGDLVGNLFPARLGPGGWRELADATVDTAAMSVLAFAIAAVGGLLAAVLAARGGTLGSTVVGWATRLVMLLLRAVPAPVWAFLMVLILFPGIWPGAVALGVYNLGVLGRLFAEIIEDHDDRAQRQLASTGASRVQQLVYAVLPSTGPRLIAVALYRWEVIARETVIVGVVGAAGLGRLLQDHLVARDFAAVVSVLGALVVLTGVIDLVSRRLRMSWS